MSAVASDSAMPAGLQEAIASGEAHTVRVCFGDHYGVLRGRRICADVFAAGPARQGFCDGALVWDIRCDIFEETDFSNYRTGYPDLYVVPELETLRPCAWSSGEWTVLGDCWNEEGERIDVDPRGVLRSVAARAAVGEVRLTLELQAPGLGKDEGAVLLSSLADAAAGLGVPVEDTAHDLGAEIVSLPLAPASPLAAADGLLLLRGAARELAARARVELSAMAQLEPGGRLSRILVDLGSVPDAGAAARARELALLLAPLPAGAAGLAESEAAASVEASSDANPHLALAASLAAYAEERPSPSAPADDGGGDPYRAAIERFRVCEWAGEWFPPLLVHDTLALAEREASIATSAGGPWDRDRYWECG